MALDTEKLNTSDAEQVVTFANSPNYIFNNLRTNSFVKALSNRYSASELADELLRRLKLPLESVGELAAPYMYLVAISFFEPKDSLPAITSIPDKGLEWAREIKGMIRGGASASSLAKIEMRPQVHITTNALDGNDSSTNVIQMKSGLAQC